MPGAVATVRSARTRPGDKSAVRGVLQRSGPAGGLLADRRRERLPPGGLRASSTATSIAAGVTVPRAPTCIPVMTGRTSRCARTRFVTRILFDGTRAVGVECTQYKGVRQRRIRAGEIILCGGAINTPQLLQLSGVGPAEPPQSLGIDARDRPAGRRGQPAGPPRGLRAVRLQAARVGQPAHLLAAQARCRGAVAVRALRHRRLQSLRRRRLLPQQRRRRLSQPDVPLPADGDPLRRDGARGRSGLPGARRPDVFGRARTVQIRSRIRAAPACSSTTCRPTRTDANGSRPSASRAHPQSAGARRVQRRRDLAGTGGGHATSRSWSGSSTTPKPRCIPPARRRWGTGEDAVLDPDDDARARNTRAAGGRCLAFPYVTNGNTYAPTMMVAEKSADLVLGNTPLPPATTPFYRLRDGSPLYPPGDTRNSSGATS
jgi:choline dehydrogenase